MNDRADNPPLPFPLPEESPRSSRWPLAWAALAWVVIVGFVALHFFQEARRESDGEDRIGLITMRTQARYMVGMREILDMPGVYDQARALNTGPVSQRLRFVVLAGELRGPTEARKQLRELDRRAREQGVAFTPPQQALHNLLDHLYRDYEHLRFDAPLLSPKDRQQLRSGLGWFGELALAPGGKLAPLQFVLPIAGGPAATALRGESAPDAAAREKVLEPARQTFAALLGVTGGSCFLVLAGIIGTIVFLVLVARGVVRSGVRCGTSPGGVYAETFALWLLLWTGLGLAGRLLPAEAPRLLLSGAAALLSLAVLAWPVLRGVPWRQVREDIGLTAGRNPAVEPLCGVTCYGISVTLLVVVVLMAVGVMFVVRGDGGEEQNFAPYSGPAHPIVEDVASGDFWARFEVILLACVVAPVVEEIMFRGVLYRHLREASCGLGTGRSFLVSATVVNFLFAIIHPQGLLGVPFLMALAYGFASAREWRGTLVPCMVGHALNNGLVMLVTMLVLGD